MKISILARGPYCTSIMEAPSIFKCAIVEKCKNVPSLIYVGPPPDEYRPLLFPKIAVLRTNQKARQRPANPGASLIHDHFNRQDRHHER